MDPAQPATIPAPPKPLKGPDTLRGAVRNRVADRITTGSWEPVAAKGSTTGVSLAKSPKVLKITVADGKDKGKTSSSIYSVAGNTFKRCSMRGDLPKDFEIRQGQDHLIREDGPMLQHSFDGRITEREQEIDPALLKDSAQLHRVVKGVEQRTRSK